MNRFWMSVLGIAFIASSCHKYSVPPEDGSINYTISYEANGGSLMFDSIMYTNASGNSYSVSKLLYYISDITYIGVNGLNYTDNSIHYINAKDPSTASFTSDNIPINSYSGIKFLIGLNGSMNKTGSLPGTIENINMAWPQMMGGGYHFLKFEGNFIDSLALTKGYALHLGTDTCLVNVEIIYPFEVKYKNQQLQLKMNVDEWFDDPNQYDLNKANAIMGNQDRMLEISQNGHNVISIIE